MSIYVPTSYHYYTLNSILYFIRKKNVRTIEMNRMDMNSNRTPNGNRCFLFFSCFFPDPVRRLALTAIELYSS